MIRVAKSKQNLNFSMCDMKEFEQMQNALDSYEELLVRMALDLDAAGISERVLSPATVEHARVLRSDLSLLNLDINALLGQLKTWMSTPLDPANH